MNKKIVKMQGEFLMPVAVGQRALLSCGGKVIKTSRVVAIHKRSRTKLFFETLNTHYRVSMSPSPKAPISLFSPPAMAA